MALTIIKEPEILTPAFNPIEYTFKSNQQTIIDFAYIVTVLKQGGSALVTFRIPGGLTNDQETTVDISSKLDTLQYFGAWRYDVVGSEYIYFEPKFRPLFGVRIQEYYNGSIQSTYNAADRWTIPASLPVIRFAYWDYNAVNALGRWLTNFEQIKVRREDKLTLSYLEPSVGTTNFVYKFYSASNTLLHTGTLPVPSPEPGNVFHLHTGLTELKTALTLSDTVYNNTDSYTVSSDNNNPLRIKVIPADCRHTGVRIHYLNEWGAVDSFVFNLALRRSASIIKKDAKLTGKSTALKPSIFGVGSSPYLVQYTDNLKLTSDFISDNDANALLEMFTSPIVAIETEQNLFFPSAPGNKIVLPCKLELTNYDIKQKVLEKLHNLEIDVKIAVDNTRQSL